MNLIETLEKEEIARLGKTIPPFSPGDTVIVNVNVVEGERKRVQAFEGVVVAKRNRGLNSSFIVQGAAGIFLKQSPLDELIESIRAVAAGETRLDPAFSFIGEEAAKSGRAAPPVFNERKRRVLRFVLEGLSNKEIAWKLQISESYVKAILQSLFQKTGVRTRGQLVRVAFEQYEDEI